MCIHIAILSQIKIIQQNCFIIIKGKYLIQTLDKNLKFATALFKFCYIMSAISTYAFLLK